MRRVRHIPKPLSKDQCHAPCTLGKLLLGTVVVEERLSDIEPQSNEKNSCPCANIHNGRANDKSTELALRIPRPIFRNYTI